MNPCFQLTKIFFGMKNNVNREQKTVICGLKLALEPN